MTSTNCSSALAFQTSYAGSIPVTRSTQIPSLTSADNPEYKVENSATVLQPVSNAADMRAALVADLHIALLEAEDIR